MYQNARMTVWIAAIVIALGAAVEADAQTCYVPVKTTCCKEAGATLTKECENGDYKWVCEATIEKDIDIWVTKRATKGKKFSRAAANTETCSYKKPKCGASAGTCELESQTDTQCTPRSAEGAECTSSNHTLAIDSVNWDLMLAFESSCHGGEGAVLNPPFE